MRSLLPLLPLAPRPQPPLLQAQPPAANRAPQLQDPNIDPQLQAIYSSFPAASSDPQNATPKQNRSYKPIQSPNQAMPYAWPGYQDYEAKVGGNTGPIGNFQAPVLPTFGQQMPPKQNANKQGPKRSGRKGRKEHGKRMGSVNTIDHTKIRASTEMSSIPSSEQATEIDDFMDYMNRMRGVELDVGIGERGMGGSPMEDGVVRASSEISTTPAVDGFTNFMKHHVNTSGLSLGLQCQNQYPISPSNYPLPETASTPYLDAARHEFESKTEARRAMSREYSYDSETEEERWLSRESSVTDEDEAVDQRAASREPSVAGDPLDATVDDDGFISDVDSEYLEHQEKLEKWRLEIEKLKNDEDRDEDFDRPNKRPKGAGRGSHKGPRKAAEPSGDIKLRLSHASQLFIQEKYEESRQVVLEIIRINAETFEAWTLLATIYRELGNIDYTVYAFQYAAHLRPRHASSWLYCAKVALEETGEFRHHYLKVALFCYSALLRRGGSPNNHEAHLGKADINYELGKYKLALASYQTALKLKQHDLYVLQKIAECCIEADQVETAKNYYQESIAYFRANPPSGTDEPFFGWEDAITLGELYAFSNDHAQALKELKSLSRWLLGREEEEFWDAATDDCEWDADDTRRTAIADFVANEYPVENYGEGLPLELRIKLGSYRFKLGDCEEAMRHFEWLDPKNKTGKGIPLEYPYLCREVADQLFEAKLFKEALPFYMPLKEIPEENVAKLHTRIGKCLLEDNLDLEAEKYLETAVELDSSYTEPRMLLAKVYEKLEKPQKAVDMINEVTAIQLKENPPASLLPKRKYNKDPTRERSRKERPKHVPRPLLPKAVPEIVERARRQAERAERLQIQYSILKNDRDRMREDDMEATKAWMNAARELTDDFRSVKTFYPWDKYLKFTGYTEWERKQAQVSLDPGLSDMAQRLSKDLVTDAADKPAALPLNIPADYRGIKFQAWLDLFMEYALCLAKAGNVKESYRICIAALDTIVFCHSKEDMFLIHVTWCMCALISNDEESIVMVARYFMKEYQFTKDAYRIFSALTRMCQAPVSWYSSGPNQKFVLRQVRAMDYGLVDESTREERFYEERASYSAIDKNGNPIVNKDFDISLLMMYGFILYSGASYVVAINYFLRAHAIDTTNPMINLALGLAYIHHAIKRQTENRQYSIMQGLTFVFKYYDSRKESPHLEERLEAHYNIGRAYHLVGLTHLAIPYYWKVLNETEEGDKDKILVEAAYNLQTIYTLAGNKELAMAVTKEFLVL